MRIRSHLDPTFFVIFLHVDAREYDEEFRTLARSLKARRGTDVAPVFAALSDRQRRTLAHERYHFWQGLRLPFVHLFAAVTFREFFLGAREMAQKDADWRRWERLGAIAPRFNRLDIQFHVAGDRSGQFVLGLAPHSGYEFNLALSAKEMLECTASIFDYQLSCESRVQMSDPVHLKRWRKRNPAYFRILEFLESFLASDRLALRVALPMLNAAFHTSFPERALFDLSARVWGNFAKPDRTAKAFLSQEEPCRWPELFHSWLRELDYDCSFGTLPDVIDLDNGEYYYLDPQEVLGLSFGGGMMHPFLGPLACEWRERAKVVPGMEFYLDLPGYVSNDEAHKFAVAAEPQLRIVRVFLDDGSDKVFAVGDGLVAPAFQDAHFGQVSASEFRGLILDALAVYGAFRRATGIQMAEGPRTCYHAECPHFEGNYCSTYPLIPERFEECGFPERLQDWITANRS